MSGCNREDLEALVYGELSSERTEQVQRHAAECSECGDELAWLRTERAVMTERERQEPELPAELWAGIEGRIDAAPAKAESERRGLLATLFPWSGERARWFGFGLATAAAAATLLFVVMRSPNEGGAPQVAVGADAGASEPAPVPAREDTPNDRLAEADQALDEAEAAHLAAIAALEAAYSAERDKLDPAVATRYDEQFREMRATLDGARVTAGDDIGARLRVLDAYSAHRRSMKSALHRIQETD